VKKPTGEEMTWQIIDGAKKKSAADLQKLLSGNDTWTLK
jgi:hypothetical protein